MGKHGTNGVNGVLVARTFSGDSGIFGVIYTIPSQLYGQSIIDLLMVGLRWRRFGFGRFLQQRRRWCGAFHGRLHLRWNYWQHERRQLCFLRSDILDRYRKAG